MLQKLEDFWTYKDWEVLQRKESRPVFGPLKKVYDSSDDQQTECRNWFADGSGDSENNKEEKLDCKHSNKRKRQSTAESSQSKFYESNEKTNEEGKFVPGWYSVQNWTRKFERDMQIPEYTGYCISQKDYNDHLLDYCRETNKSAKMRCFSQTAIREIHGCYDHKNSTTKSEIDKDIADIASEHTAGDSAVKIGKKVTAKLNCQKSRIYQKQPVRIKTIRMKESDITVNITESKYSLLNIRHITNTKTPCQTPELTVQRQNMFNQMTFSTKALLQRSYNKVNFLSSKQRADPEKPLFQPKSDLEVNFTNFWESKSHTYVTCSSYQYRPTASVICLPGSLASSSAATQGARKRTSSCKTDHEAKRQKTAIKSHVKTGNQVTLNSINLFAVPLFIPSHQNKTSTPSTKDLTRY